MLRHFFTINSLSILISLGLSSCTHQAIKPSDHENISSVSSYELDTYKSGITALNDKDYAKAQRIFNQLIRNQPNIAGPYTNLALLHYKKGNIDESFKLVNKALDLNQDQAQAYNLRAQLFIKKNNIKDAKNDYIKAVHLKPDYINAHYNLALLYDIYLQDIALAIQHYEVYLSLLKKPDQATQDWVSHLKGIQQNG